MVVCEIVAAERKREADARELDAVESGETLLPDEVLFGADSEHVNASSAVFDPAELSARPRAQEGLLEVVGGHRAPFSGADHMHLTAAPAVAEPPERSAHQRAQAGMIQSDSARTDEAARHGLPGAVLNGDRVLRGALPPPRPGNSSSERPDASSRLLNPNADAFVPRVGRGAREPSLPNQGANDFADVFVPRVERRAREPSLPNQGANDFADVFVTPVGLRAREPSLPNQGANDFADVFVQRVGRRTGEPSLLNPGAIEFVPRAHVQSGEPHPHGTIPQLNPFNNGSLGERYRHMPDAAPQRQLHPRVIPQQHNPFINRALSEGGGHVLDLAPQRQVRAVWREDWATEAVYLSSLLNQGKRVLIAFDTEYVAPAPPATEHTGPPQGAAEWYHRLCRLVTEGEVIQLAFVLRFEDSTAAAPLIFEMNIFFDPSLRAYNPETLRFLEKSGHLLQKHKDHGVMPASVAEWVRSNLENLTAATWVVFQGDTDFAFLLRSFALEQFELPLHRLEFLQTLRRTIRRYFDVRVLGLKLLLREERGFSLNSLGTSLGIQRLGQAHGSASDALLTLDCFDHIRRTFGDQIHPLVGILCGLYGTESLVRSAMPLYAENLKLIEVWRNSFSEFAAFVLTSIDCNFCTIGLHIEFYPDLQYKECSIDEYERFRSSVLGVVTAKVTVAMASIDGQLAGGQICMFNISFDDKPRRFGNGNYFATILLSHMDNRKITWVTFHGTESVACIYRAVKGLPPSPDEYFHARVDMFPHLYDLAFFTEPGNKTLHKFCQDCSVRVAKSTGDEEHDAVLIVRCFLHILESTDPLELDRKKGHLMQKPETQVQKLNVDGTTGAAAGGL